MKKIILPVVLLSALAAAAVWYFYFRADEFVDELTIKPEKGEFVLTVMGTGELQAKNSIDIKGPSRAQMLNIYQLKISKLVPEGTIVKEGDFVAELDQSEVLNQLKELDLSIDQRRSELQQSKIDTTLELSQARDQLINLKFSLEEKKLMVEQSMYEPPTVIRQAEIDYDRTLRSFNQSLRNYDHQVKKAETKVSILQTRLNMELQKKAQIMEILEEFTITAPAPGMVIYAREWGGRRKVVGSTISAWNPTVAKLPDLSQMESLTYINEIDIQKIKKEQNVNISLDALPDKKLSGKIIKVANIGEQLRGSNSKVFEVIIDIEQKDTTLLPAMTTSNEIIVSKVPGALYIPLECLHALEQKEGKLTYVYKKDGSAIIRQEVLTGMMNDNEVIIEDGLNAEDEILLSVPVENKNYEIHYLKDKNA
ncbi:MAG: efflux RND transporter periplasmic adaptor subunit [Candidatus Kapaibacterium sp.]